MNFQEAVLEEDGEEGEIVRDSGVDVASSPTQQEPAKSANLAAPSASRHHQRRPSDYDGSDYGGGSDLDSPGMPPGLVSRIDLVESLARRGTESTGGDQDNVVKRLVDGLKELGGQSGVEGGATRYECYLYNLVTAYANNSQTHHSSLCSIITSTSPNPPFAISCIPPLCPCIYTTRRRICRRPHAPPSLAWRVYASPHDRRIQLSGPTPWPYGRPSADPQLPLRYAAHVPADHNHRDPAPTQRP
jgi:hypothetical protein